MKKAATPCENNGLSCATTTQANIKPKPPLVSGQCAEVLAMLLEHCPMLAIELPAMGIPQYCARIHDLRAKGYNIISTIEYDVSYQGRIYSRAARLSLGTPLWGEPSSDKTTLDLFPEEATL